MATKFECSKSRDKSYKALISLSETEEIQTLWFIGKLYDMKKKLLGLRVTNHMQLIGLIELKEKCTLQKVQQIRKLSASSKTDKKIKVLTQNVRKLYAF